MADDAGTRNERATGLGPALRRAWIGYQRRLDKAMADAGFDERRFPDGRVLRLCSEPAGSTISNIGRELGMTRQGASKLVGHLQERGYVAVADSATSRREKAVTLSELGSQYLDAQRSAVRTIEDEVRAELAGTGLGEEILDALYRLLDVLDGDQVRMRTYLSNAIAVPAIPTVTRNVGIEIGSTEENDRSASDRRLAHATAKGV
jgi:DNA-binding MarR family transcriptional regulator